MKVIDIIEKYLKDNGYDGLCTDDCGCHLGDLIPCYSQGVLDCVPGYKISAAEARKRFQGTFEHCDFIIVEEKEVEA